MRQLHKTRKLRQDTKKERHELIQLCNSCVEQLRQTEEIIEVQYDIIKRLVELLNDHNVELIMTQKRSKINVGVKKNENKINHRTM